MWCLRDFVVQLLIHRTSVEVAAVATGSLGIDRLWEVTGVRVQVDHKLVAKLDEAAHLVDAGLNFLHRGRSEIEK